MEERNSSCHPNIFALQTSLGWGKFEKIIERGKKMGG